jgi:PAS domain S-box-containing protein
VTTRSGSAAISVDTSVGQEPHLRAVLETQPVTLIRLGRDGTVLAVNEAGLAVIGAEQLEQILDTSFAALLSPADRTGFLVFVERVASGHRGSLEVGLTALTGTSHTIQVHAAPHPGAPDGIDSVLVTLRDVTESRRLEQSLVDAMARQAEQEAAHEAQRSRLAGDLDRAREGATSADAYLAQIVELEARLQAAETARAAAAERHAAEVRGLTEAFEERQRAADEQAARIQRLANVETQLAQLSERYDAVDALRASLAQELEQTRLQAEAAQNSASGRYDADVGALRDALNASMNEQAEAAARARHQSEADAARLHVLETALVAAETARRAATARLREITRGNEEVARRVMELATAAGADAGLAAGDLGRRLEAAIKAVIGPQLSLSIMIAAPDAPVDAAPDVIQQALVALAANRAGVIESGQLAIELAAVRVDEGAARSRGGMPCGAYWLVAMHVSGVGAGEGLSSDVFECADRHVWELADPALFTAFESARLAGGWTWLAREGDAGIVLEIYLPRETDGLEGSLARG